MFLMLLNRELQMSHMCLLGSRLLARSFESTL